MLKKGSAHLTYTVHGVVAGFGALSITGAGDDLFRLNRSRDDNTATLRMTAQGQTSSQTTRTETIQVGTHTATRTDGKAWKCSTSKSSSTGFNPKHPIAAYKALETLGPSAVNGVATWQVRGTQRSVPETDIFDLSQSDHVILRVNVTLSDSSTSPPSSLTLIEDLTGYGENITIELPPKCKVPR
jgi:hypothetical protein